VSNDEPWQLETIYVTVHEDKPSSGNGGSTDSGHGGGTDTKGQDSGGSGNYDHVSHEQGWNTVRSNREPSTPPQSSAESPYGKTTAPQSNSQSRRTEDELGDKPDSVPIESPLKAPSAWDEIAAYFESVRDRTPSGAAEFWAALGGTTGVSDAPGSGGGRYPVIKRPVPYGTRPSGWDVGLRLPTQLETARVPTTPKVPARLKPGRWSEALKSLAQDPRVAVLVSTLWSSDIDPDIPPFLSQQTSAWERADRLRRRLPGASQDGRPLVEPRRDLEVPARRDPTDPAHPWVEPSRDEAVRDDPASDLEGPLEASEAQRMFRWVRELMQSGWYLDPTTNEWTHWEGPMEADHFIPVRYIKTMPGFQKLNVHGQSLVLGYWGNIQPLPRHHNRSKSDWMPSEWHFTRDNDDGEFVVVDADYLAEAAIWEEKVISSLQKEIRRLLREQSKWQRDKAWGSGWPW
jgi:hypothetical protein